GGHDVAVVALSHGDEAVGVLRPGPAQQVGLRAVADDEAASKAVGEDPPRREAGEGPRAVVDDGDVVAVPVQLLGQPRPHPTTADDEYLHRQPIVCAAAIASAGPTKPARGAESRRSLRPDPREPWSRRCAAGPLLR